MLNCRRKIKKTKVYDLLYASKKNENNIVKKSKGNIFVFILSIILLLSALFITYKQFLDVNQMSDKQIFIAIILLIIGIYLFYIGLSSFIIKRFINNKKRKYKNNNMFLYRNLASKINTMSFTTATITLMFTIILIGGNVALLMNNMLNNEIEMGYPYEIMISTADGDFSKYKEYIEDNAEVKAMYEYKMYYIKETGISKALEDTILKDKTGNIENVFSLTDYNQLREIAGYDKLELQENEILINCMKTLEKPFKEYIKENNEINMFGQKMTIKDVRSENIAQVGFNGSYYAIIVPDKLIPLAEFEEESIRNQENGEYQIYTFDFNYKLVVQTEETTDENFYYELIDFIITKEEKINVDINGEEEEVSSIKYLRKCTN